MMFVGRAAAEHVSDLVLGLQLEINVTFMDQRTPVYGVQG